MLCSLRPVILFFLFELMIYVRNVKQTYPVIYLGRLLTDISRLLAEAILELLVGWRTHLVCHCHYRLLLFLRDLRCILLNDDLFLNDGLTILILLILIHNISSTGMEILLTLVAPCTFNTKPLVISGSEPACLCNAAEVIIGEAKGPIFESSLVIVLTLIRLRTPFLELWLSDPFDSPALTLVILAVHVSTDHASCQVRRLMCTCTA